MVSLVIFDCDGVLVDSERIANRILAEELTRIGLPTSTDDSIKTYMGRSSVDNHRVIEESLGKTPPDSFHQAVKKRTRQAFDEGLQMIPGIDIVLAGLDISVCVASSGGYDKIRKNLTITGLRRFFSDESIFSAEDVVKGKPAPDLFLMAAKRMGRAPRECVVVEDSVPGVKAAISAGMRALGYSDLTPGSELKRAGAEVFFQMTDLPGLIGKRQNNIYQ